MSTIWQCGVCETVNQGGHLCRACGSALTLRAEVARTAKGILAQELPPAVPATPLPEPVRRSINRDPVPDDEWEAYGAERELTVLPLPGGCLFAVGPKSRGLW